MSRTPPRTKEVVPGSIPLEWDFIDKTPRMNQNRAWALECLAKLGRSELWNAIKWEFVFCGGFTARRADASYDHKERTGYVRFSADQWPLGEEANRKQTVYHEVCHIVDMHDAWMSLVEALKTNPLARKRRCGHYKPWKRLMVEVGMPPNRCSSVSRPLELVRFVARLELKCKCVRSRPWVVTCTRFTRWQNLYGVVHCAKCQSPVSKHEAPKPMVTLADTLNKPVDR